MKSLADTKEQIRKFVTEKLASTRKINQVQDQDNLIENGIIDSMGIMRLVAYIESEFVMKVKDEDIVPENFESVEVISSYIETVKAVDNGGNNA